MSHSYGKKSRVNYLPRVAITVLGLVTLSCGGGGGGGHDRVDGESTTLILESLVFHDPSFQTVEREGQGPAECSLIQQIHLKFSGTVPLDHVSHQAIHIRDRRTSIPVEATFSSAGGGSRLVLTPRLPKSPAQLEGEDWIVDSGLEPSTEYEVVILVDHADAVPGLVGISPELAAKFDFIDGSLIVPFSTTGTANRFWDGIAPVAPQWTSIEPAPRSQDVPLHLFSDPSWVPFRVEFDAALHPELVSTNSQSILLRDLIDHTGGSPNRNLAIQVWIEVNEIDYALVRINPIGILPGGHRLGLAVPIGLRGLGESESPFLGHEIISRFETRRVEGGLVDDEVLETFADKAREERDPVEIDRALVPADWDENDSDRLEAALDFPGFGELGRFIPRPDDTVEKIVVLDTDRQHFPIPDGSTPDAPSDTIIEGGVFNFTTIDIPPDVRIVGRGSNPLILTATETVLIAGTIDVNGEPGASENAIDQSLAPVHGGPGGPDGGQGGDSHPSVFDQGTLVSPRFGLHGKTSSLTPRLEGGRGGEGGVYTGHEIICRSGRGVGAGGGGGSMYGQGYPGGDGSGEEHVTSSERFDVDGRTIWIELIPSVTRGGNFGDVLFRDSNAENDFIGRRGEYRSILGGQGGGGAGSRHDAFWCEGHFPGLPPTVADSRGGAGGGGGGALGILSLGPITFLDGATILARGGDGGHGEMGPRRLRPRGGGGGGGSGGMIRVMTPETISVPGRRPLMDVFGGEGALIKDDLSQGGNGGHGLVQIQQSPDVPVNERRFWVLPERALVPTELTPTEISPVSVGQSSWINLGAGVFREEGTGPRFSFKGIDEAGFVITDEEGRIPDPQNSDIRVDQLPVIDPLTGRMETPGFKDRLPENAWVRIEFQSAMAKGADIDEVDPNTKSAWSPDIGIGNGRQFIRFRVVMNIAQAPYPLSRHLPLIATRSVRLSFKF